MSLRACIAAGALACATLALSARGAEPAPAPSPVTRALFARSGNAFVPPQENEPLKVLLARKPSLDFFETCAVGTLSDVQSMLKANPDLRASWHSSGWAPLHFAAFGGNVPVADFLIARGAHVDERARNGFRNGPLAVALLSGQLAMAKLLIERGADLNARQAGGAAPLHEAALLGRRDLVDLLLQHGAEIGARANDGRNAVSEAERGRHADLAAYLRSRGGKDATITADLSRKPAAED